MVKTGRRHGMTQTGVERRKPGRPAKLVPDEVLHVRVSVELYDRICRLALKVDKPVTVAARMMLERDLARLEQVL